MRKHNVNLQCRIFDEHSQAGRPFWAWFKYRHEELRRPRTLLDNGNNVVRDKSSNFPLSEAMYSRPWGGIPFIYSFGDCSQLPPVMMKAIYDDSESRTGTSDHLGRIVVKDFTGNISSHEASSFVIMMDEVLRQSHSEFLSLLDNMRNDTISDEDVSFIISRCIDKLSNQERNDFKDAIHLVPMWNMTDKIVFDYLLKFDSPIAKIRPILTTIRSNGENYCLKELSYPLNVALCEGAIVMLLKNFVVELNVMNGSVGIVRKIVYKNKEGPNSSRQSLPSYVIVEFRNASIPPNKKAFGHLPNTFIPIPVVTEHCEKCCCSMSTIPLQVCVALTIHKSQGMTIGPGEVFEKAVVYFPDTSNGQKSTPGLELVGMSRVKDPSCLAIGNMSTSLSVSDIKKIGSSKANKKVKEFRSKLTEQALSSKLEIIQKIKSLHGTNSPDEEPSFDGGCAFLLNWFWSTFSN